MIRPTAGLLVSARRTIAALSACVSLTCTVLVIAATVSVASASASPGGVLTRLAGTGTRGTPTPGLATSSRIGTSYGLAVDSSGNVYVADSYSAEVEKITPAGTLSVIAGTGTPGTPTPGLATSSELQNPGGVAVNAAGDVYIADPVNHVVEEVTPARVLSIVAGTGVLGAATPGPATSSEMKEPQGVSIDGQGDLFIADSGANQVYEVSAAGTLSIIAGSGAGGPPTAGPATSSALQAPSGAFRAPDGDVYIADTYNHVVEKVTPAGMLSVMAGTGTNGFPTTGPATSSELGYPYGLGMDADGNLYIADANDISELSPNGTLTVVAGDTSTGAPTYGGLATASSLLLPFGVAVTPAGRLYIADTINYTIDEVAGPLPVSTVAPTITGTTTSGQTLSATTGTWTEFPEIYTYQWQDCDSTGANCTAITGATASSYTLTSSDVGDTVQVIVTAENSGGSVAAGSAASAVIAAVPAPPTPAPATTTPATTTPTTTTTTPAAPVAALPVTLGPVPSAGVQVSSSGQAMLSLVCPQTSTGCDASGVLTIFLPNSSDALTDPLSGVNGTVLASFSGKMIASGQSALVSVRLSPTVLQRLQSLYIRRVKVTLNLSNHLTGGPTLNSTQTLYLLIPGLSAARCADPAGQLNATTLGAVTLGATRTRTQKMLPRFTVRSYHTDNFCLAGGQGVRVGYASQRLLGTTPAAKHTTTGTVVLALTANRFYTLGGVRPGARLASAARKLKLAAPIRAGTNIWYVVSGATSNGLLKVRHGIIQEVGIVNKKLTNGRVAQLHLLRNF